MKISNQKENIKKKYDKTLGQNKTKHKKKNMLQQD